MNTTIFRHRVPARLKLYLPSRLTALKECFFNVVSMLHDDVVSTCQCSSVGYICFVLF